MLGFTEFFFLSMITIDYVELTFKVLIEINLIFHMRRLTQRCKASICVQCNIASCQYHTILHIITENLVFSLLPQGDANIVMLLHKMSYSLKVTVVKNEYH